MAWHSYTSVCPSTCVDLEPLKTFRPDEGSTVLDHTGAEIGMLYRKNRRVVPLSDLPPHVAGAFLAVEDRRFRNHNGIDWWRVGGAVVANARARGVAEGFSTITMQLARNVFPEALPYTERTLRRKLMEVRVARDIEKHFSKDEILAFYLNSIYLGSGAYGIEAAARTYFGVPASSLSVAQAALLAGLPKAPSRYSPYRDVDAARTRRDLVLALMHSARTITTEALHSARDESINLAHGSQQEAIESASATAPYFVEEIRRRLEERFGEELYKGGLRIYTTLDKSLQEAAERELEAQLRRIERNEFARFRGPVRDSTPEMPEHRKTGYLQGAALFLDPLSGDVRALVGGRSFEESEFNRVTQSLRQPGSSFKPIVYAAAVEVGVAPQDSVSDGPISIPTGTGAMWQPKNFSEDKDRTTNMMTIAEALRTSRNRAAVRVAHLVGLDSVVAVAHRMGIKRKIPLYPAISLGSTDVTMLELVTAYTPLARTDGNRVEPRLVTRVEDRAGRLLMTNATQTEPALDPATAGIVRGIMKQVVEQGTGRAVRTAGYKGPAAGKTGTTNGSTDTWFVGFTSELVGAVWIGFDEPQKILSGTAATGGVLAAPVWGRILAATDTAPATEDPWPLPEETAAIVARGRTIAQCPHLNRIARSAPSPATDIDPSSSGAASESGANDAGESTDDLNEDLVPKQPGNTLLDRILARLAQREVHRRGPRDYVCVPTAALPSELRADSTEATEESENSQESQENGLLERLRRSLGPSTTH